MDKNVQYAIEIVDKWGKPLKQLESSLDKLDKKKVKSPFNDVSKSIGQLNRDIARYKKLQEESFRTDHIRKYNILIERAENKIKELNASTATCATKTKGLHSSLTKKVGWVAVAYGAKRAADSLAKFGMESINAAAKFEQYQVTLRTMLGSQSAARERMSDYARIASTTPFELDQVVSAGNQLQAIGRYSEDNLKMLGDLAAASGKPIEQVLNAFAKLSTGQKGEAVNMFRDLLISTDDWAEAVGKGKKANGELIASTEDMIKALPKILGKKGFLGMMAEQSQTTSGRVSNLKDNVHLLKVAVGERLKPAYDDIVTSTSGLIRNMTDMVEIPTAEKIAREKAELNALVGVITDANTETDVRKELMDDLIRKYPELKDRIDKEKESNEALLGVVREINAEYDKRIKKAAWQSMFDDLSQKTAEQQELINTYRMSIAQRKESERLFSELNEILRPIAQKEGVSYSPIGAARAIAESTDINSASIPGSTEEYGRQTSYKVSFSKNEKEAIATLLAQYNAARSLVERRDEKKEAKAKAAYEKYKAQLAILKRAMDDEFDDDSVNDKKTQNSAPLNDSSDLGQGNGTLSGSSLNAEVEKAQSVISGGGKNIKQIIINLDSLIAENNNIFSEGQDPADASDFTDKLAIALQSVLNDVNYR